LLLRILKGDGGPDIFEKAEPVKDVESEIAEKMSRGNTKTLPHLGKIEFFPEG